MMDEISLHGSKQDLIDILESHIAYLEASGWDYDNPNYTCSELINCRNFLMQLDETSSFLKEDND